MTAALEAGEHGIRVNAIAPGATLTPFTTWRHHRPDGTLDQEAYDAFVEQSKQQSPLAHARRADRPGAPHPLPRLRRRSVPRPATSSASTAARPWPGDGRPGDGRPGDGRPGDRRPGDDQSGSSPVSVSCVASSATATLRRWEVAASRDVERLTGGEVPAFHEDALGLPDDVAGAERCQGKAASRRVRIHTS